MSELKDLKSLFGEDKVVKIAGQDIKIKQIEFGNIPTILDLVDKIFGEIPDAKNNTEIALLINKALVKDFDSVSKVIITLTDLKADQVKKLNLAAATKIASEIVEVNADFLLQNVVPVAKETFQKLTGTVKSKDLSSGATQKTK